MTAHTPIRAAEQESPGVLRLLSRAPCEEAIEREIAATGFDRWVCINRIRSRQIIKYRNHLAGGTRGASNATSYRSDVTGERHYFREGF